MGYKCSGEIATENRASCTDGEECPSGTVSPAACPPGKYGGAGTCTDVAAGKYQLGDGTETACPVRFFCQGGSAIG